MPPWAALKRTLLLGEPLDGPPDGFGGELPWLPRPRDWQAPRESHCLSKVYPRDPKSTCQPGCFV